MNARRWYCQRLRAMTLTEIAWRTLKKLRKTKTANLKLSNDAAEHLETLPPFPAPLLIQFFDQSLEIQSEQDLQWNRDNKSGITCPPVHYSKVNYRDVTNCGDPKIIWELNRHQFLFAVISNEALQTDQKATILCRILTHWIRENPEGVGINWTSSLELAIRILNWGILLDQLGNHRIIIDTRYIILQSVQQQAEHIRENLSEYSSANNHLMGELTGLLAASVFFPETDPRCTLRTYVTRRLLKEWFNQTNLDGVNREQATYYHAYTLEYMLTCIELWHRASMPVSEVMSQLCIRMLQFLINSTTLDGHLQAIGDQDDGQVTGLLLNTATPWAESLLWHGALRFSHPELASHAASIARNRGAKSTPDPRTNYWIEERPRTWLEAATGPPQQGLQFYPESGYAFYKTDRIDLTFKGGPFGYPSIAAHSHCDQLAIWINIDGIDVLTDSGTFAYHDDDLWRRYFRGTSAHNTVALDGIEQADYGGPFLWLNHPKCQLMNLGHSAFHLRGVLEVNNSAGNYQHTREIQLQSNRLIVHDHTQSNKARTINIVWNFGPGITFNVPIQRVQTQRFIAKLSNGKLLRITTTDDSPEPPDAQILNGSESPIGGWHSRAFGVKQAINQLRLSRKSLEWKITTTFEWDA